MKYAFLKKAEEVLLLNRNIFFLFRWFFFCNQWKPVPIYLTKWINFFRHTNNVTTHHKDLHRSAFTYSSEARSMAQMVCDLDPTIAFRASGDSQWERILSSYRQTARDQPAAVVCPPRFDDQQRQHLTDCCLQRSQCLRSFPVPCTNWVTASLHSDLSSDTPETDVAYHTSSGLTSVVDASWRPSSCCRGNEDICTPLEPPLASSSPAAIFKIIPTDSHQWPTDQASRWCEHIHGWALRTAEPL